MKSQSCQTNMPSQRAAAVQCTEVKKAAGRNIARLERQLEQIDRFEDDIKHKMQDRLKFPSGKNAMRMNNELKEIDKLRGSVRAEIARLQDLDCL